MGGLSKRPTVEFVKGSELRVRQQHVRFRGFGPWIQAARAWGIQC